MAKRKMKRNPKAAKAEQDTWGKGVYRLTQNGSARAAELCRILVSEDPLECKRCLE